jgi:hypothetical protein
MRYLLLFTLLLAACATPEADAPAGDVVSTVDAEPTFEPLASDDLVRVVRATLPAGVTMGEQQRGNRVVYVLSDYEMDYIGESGEAVTAYQPGDVHAHPRERAAIVNTGETPARVVLFEELPDATPDLADDAGQTPFAVGDDSQATLLLSTPFAEVHRVRLAPGDVLPSRGYPGALYAETDFAAAEAGGSAEFTLAAGSAHTFAADDLPLANATSAPANLIVVEFKQ